MPEDNLQRLLRLNNIFNSNLATPDLSTGRGTFTGQPINTESSGMMRPDFGADNYNLKASPRQDIEDDEMGMLRKLYSPDDKYSKMYEEHINRFPERNEPGIVRRIFGTLATADPEAQERALYGPYIRQMGDWKARGEALEPLMTAERYQNMNDRMIAQNILSNRVADRRAAATEERTRGLNAASAANAESARIRAESYAALNKWRMDPLNQEMEIVKVEGGNYMLVNPKTGETRDTGIKTGTLDAREELNLRIKGEKEIAAIPRTVITSGTTTTRTEGDVNNPTQIKADQYNRAREIYNRYPQFQRSINLGDPGTNDFTIEAPREGSFGRQLRQEDWDAIQRYIYDGGPLPSITGATLPTPPPRPTGRSSTSTSSRSSISSRGAQPTNTGSRVRVRRKSDGETGTLDANDPALKSDKYEIITNAPTTR